jgi:Planctomycete cytochrome C
MRQLWFVAALAAAALAGCTSDAPPSCITVDTTCAPLYAPTFDNVYTMTLQNTCGSQNASCHSAAGQQGGMSFEDQQHAYRALLAGRVVPGNPGCSKMVVRTSSPGASYQMPPGDPLSEAERCALLQWVAAGAATGPNRAITAGGAR